MPEEAVEWKIERVDIIIPLCCWYPYSSLSQCMTITIILAKYVLLVAMDIYMISNIIKLKSSVFRHMIPAIVRNRKKSSKC